MTMAIILLSITGISITAAIRDVSDTTIEIENCSDRFEITNVNDVAESVQVSGVGGYQYEILEPLPPKTEEQLAMMDNDPQPTRSFSSLPSEFSWLNYYGDWTTPAKDQANCGSCWAFAALGAVEAGINIASGDPNTNIVLSEQYVLSCLGSSGSCSGGWMSSALQCIQSTSSGNTGNSVNGVPLDSCMPYQAKDYIPCDNKCDDWDYVDLSEDGVLWEIKDFGVTTINPSSETGWNLLKTWIMDYGPLSVDIYASGSYSSFWSNNNNPNAVYEGTESGITNHGQLLVGWKDDSTVKDGGYWILKNSWGTNWGYNGFCNVAYGSLRIGDRDVCWVTTPEWPDSGGSGPDSGGHNVHVFADLSYDLEYPLVGDAIQFTDESHGPVTLREWDFTGDGEIDSTAKRPSWVYTAEGDYEVSLTVWSTYGYSNTITRTVRVREVWPPVAVISPEEIVTNKLEVSFDGRFSFDPDGDIVSYHWDFDDGSTSSESQVTHVFSDIDRKYEVTLTVTDNEGATDSIVCPVYIDVSRAPSTTAVTGFDEGDDDVWYRSSQKVELIAEDWTGVRRTFYRVNGGSWNEKFFTVAQQVASSYVLVHEEGLNEIEFYSVDYWGNEENMKSHIVRIDTIPPSLDISISGGNMVDGWYTSPVEVTMLGSDDQSGLDTIIYRVEAGSWSEYDGSFTLDDGNHRLWAYAVDKAGNTNDDTQLTVSVDTGAPITKVDFIGEGAHNLFYKDVGVRLYARDDGSGVDSIFYRVNGGSFSVYDDEFVLDEVGSFEIEYYAVDNIGNEESVNSVSVEVSNVNFVAELTRPVSGLYIGGMNLFGFTPAIVIGPVDIMVEVEGFTGGVGDVSLVEFLIDGELIGSSSTPPFTYRLEESLMGSHVVTARVIGDGEASIELSSDVTFFII